MTLDYKAPDYSKDLNSATFWNKSSPEQKTNHVFLDSEMDNVALLHINQPCRSDKILIVVGD